MIHESGGSAVSLQKDVERSKAEVKPQENKSLEDKRGSGTAASSNPPSQGLSQRPKNVPDTRLGEGETPGGKQTASKVVEKEIKPVAPKSGVLPPLKEEKAKKRAEEIGLVKPLTEEPKKIEEVKKEEEKKEEVVCQKEEPQQT